MIYIPNINTDNTGNVKMICKIHNFDELLESFKPFIEKVIEREEFRKYQPNTLRKWVQYGLKYSGTFEGNALQKKLKNDDDNESHIRVNGPVNAGDFLIASDLPGICVAVSSPKVGDWVLAKASETNLTDGLKTVSIERYGISNAIADQTEYDFTDWIPGTEFLQTMFSNLGIENCGRVRLLDLPPFSTYGYHKDGENEWRLHIPLISNNDSFLVVDDKLWRLPVGNVYLINTSLRHTAMNCGLTRRIHLVASYSNDILKTIDTDK
jgi:hypothetical protein